MLVLQVSTADALVAHLGAAQQTALRELHARTVHGQALTGASAGAIVLHAASHVHSQRPAHSAGADTQSPRLQPSGSPVVEVEDAGCATLASSEPVQPDAAGHSADKFAVHSDMVAAEPTTLVTSVPAYHGGCNDKSSVTTAVKQESLASTPGALGAAGVSAMEITAAAEVGALAAASTSEASVASADGAAPLSDAAEVCAMLHRAVSAAAAAVANPAQVAGGQASLPSELSSTTLLVVDGRDRSAAALSRSQESIDSGALPEARSPPSGSAEAAPCPALASAGDSGAQAMRPLGEQSVETDNERLSEALLVDAAQPSVSFPQLRPEHLEGLPSAPPDEARAVADAVFGELVTLVSLSRSNKAQNASGAIATDSAFAHLGVPMGMGDRYDVQTAAAHVDKPLQSQGSGSAPLQPGSRDHGATADSTCSASGAGSALAVGAESTVPRGDALATDQLAAQDVFAELVAMSTASSPTQLTAAGGQANGAGFGGSADFAATSSHASGHLDAADPQAASVDQCKQDPQIECSASSLQVTAGAASGAPHAAVPAAAPRASSELGFCANSSAGGVLASSTMLGAAAREDVTQRAAGHAAMLLPRFSDDAFAELVDSSIGEAALEPAPDCAAGLVAEVASAQSPSRVVCDDAGSNSLQEMRAVIEQRLQKESNVGADVSVAAGSSGRAAAAGSVHLAALFEALADAAQAGDGADAISALDLGSPGSVQPVVKWAEDLLKYTDTPMSAAQSRCGFPPDVQTDRMLTHAQQSQSWCASRMADTSSTQVYSQAEISTAGCCTACC